MEPFPSVENDHGHDAGPSSVFKESSAATASDKLSALPHHSAPSSSKITRFSPPPTNLRQHRLSFDGDLLNFPASHMPNFEISPLRRLRDKFETQSSRGTVPRVAASEGNSPNNGRISIDSDHSKPTPHSGRHSTLGYRARVGSDSYLPSSSLRSPADATDGDTSPSNQRNLSSRSPSKSRSRAVSPFRFIHNLSSSMHHRRPHHFEPEEPFIPINPFKSKISFEFRTWFGNKSTTKAPDIELGEASIRSSATPSSGAEDCDVVLISSIKDCARHTHVFVGDVLPRLIYLNLLLRLPALYFSRVARIFRDAEISRPDIERMIEAGEYCILPPPFDPQIDDSALYVTQPLYVSQESTNDRRRDGGKERGQLPRSGAAHSGRGPLSNTQEACPPPIVTPTLTRFKHSWEVFIDSLLREWKTLNVVSALLASAILTIFQIPDAAGDPVTRTAAILSLICSLMSLTYGCMYIVRFSTMRSMVRASKWAEEARRTNTAILWNVWVLLAMPAVWLAWSMVIFIVTILSFVWRTGSEADPSGGRPPLSTTAALGPRIAITFLVFIGLVYIVLIVRTLKSYGMHGGNSQNILTSPPSRLQGILGPPPTPVTGENRDYNALLEAALERRGRERTRSTEVRRGRRREEGPEIREHREEYRVPIGERFKEGNKLGLYPARSNSGTR
ncbi:hypothetical protein AN958_02816 [Leucoagaricus sp. SymC.cos]|nr:hypothetical protein AN958_02816 [Leucoagaricus sp. SymC.cos]